MRHIVNTLTMSTLPPSLSPSFRTWDGKLVELLLRPEMSEEKEGIQRLLGLIDL